MKHLLQSVALAVLVALLASPAAAAAMCLSMSPAGHCPQTAMHCPDCPDDDTAKLEQQPMPMDGTCCALAPARPAPRTELQAPAISPVAVPLARTVAMLSPALPTLPAPRREAVFLLPAESPQAVLCTFLI